MVGGEPDRTIEVTIGHRPTVSRPLRGSSCGQRRPGYDRLSQRRYQFVPLWGMAVFFLYRPRRGLSGVWREGGASAVGEGEVPADHKLSLVFLASWAKLLTWQQVATVFHTSWQSVYRSVELAVLWGIAHRSLAGIKAVGVDEIQWQKGHKYLTLVYQIEDC